MHWGTTGVPSVSTTTGYRQLRLFDPVPAAFLSGTAAVTAGLAGHRSASPPAGPSLYAALGVPATPGVEVARRMIGPGIACQNVTVTDAHHLTCEGLAPDGTAAVADGGSVDLIVLGDPFALRDGVIEGLAGTLNAFDTLGSDHRPADGLADDQYTSTLPLVDLTPAQLAGERGALGTGLVDLADAATEDESGAKGGLLPVSSAQEMATAVSSLVPGSTGLTYTLGTDRLGVSLGASAAATLKAPLRFMVDGRGQVQSDDTVDVGTASTTTLAIDVVTATARARTSAGTGTSSTATVDLASFAGKRLRAGVGAGTTQASGSSAALEVAVDTTYDGTAEQLETSRSTTGVPAGSTTAATARLALVGETQPIVYSALATDSSGGTGAAQPAPEAMQVKFLAEGLDGLADAVGNALDGAAPRNTGPGGVPVSAPLIGSDLDAGANVRGVLTGLTSALRTQLAGVTATSATDLADALATRTDAAVRTAPGVSGDGATAEVTCAQGKACDPCPRRRRRQPHVLRRRRAEGLGHRADPHHADRGRQDREDPVRGRPGRALRHLRQGGRHLHQLDAADHPRAQARRRSARRGGRR